MGLFKPFFNDSTHGQNRKSDARQEPRPSTRLLWREFEAAKMSGFSGFFDRLFTPYLRVRSNPLLYHTQAGPKNFLKNMLFSREKA
jgi:hypothetical protein